MSIGMAMAGGGPVEDRQSNDYYGTPPLVTRALLIAQDFEGPIWECASGNGAMSMVLQLAGHRVISTDINPLGFGRRLDFLTTTEKLADTIVTNPPFNLAPQFIEHALGRLEVGTLALMLKGTFWHAKTRSPLYQRFTPAAIHPLLWRPDFLSKGAPTMEVMWCVWRKGHVGDPIYRPLPKPVEVAP